METYYDILRVLGKGAEKPTRVMYRANLSWSSLQVHIKCLEAQGLIEISEIGKREYHLSDKGFQILNQILSIREDLSLQNEA